MFFRLNNPLFQRGCRTGAEGQKCIIEEGNRCGETRELSHSILGVFFREIGRLMCCINARKNAYLVEAGKNDPNI